MTSVEARVGWPDVEREIARLAATGERFDTGNSNGNRIAFNDPEWRLQLETPNGVNWVDMADVKTCWETFERLGRIRRRDVLEPGRCSAFIMALFGHVPGVLTDDVGDEPYLVLPR